MRAYIFFFFYEIPIEEFEWENMKLSKSEKQNIN